MWIDLDGSKFNITHAAVLRPVDDGEDQCVLFTAGQSATDGGFLIDLPLDEAFELIQTARLQELAEMMVDSDRSEEPETPLLESDLTE